MFSDTRSHSSIPCSESIVSTAREKLSRGHFVAAAGTTKIANLDENLGSVHVELSPSDLEEVAAAVPMDEVAGDRYFDRSNHWQFANTPPLESWTPKTKA